MIEVTVGTATSRSRTAAEPAQTPREILEENGVDFSTAIIQLNGVVLNVRDLETSLEDLGVSDKCMLIASVNSKNA